MAAAPEHPVDPAAADRPVPAPSAEQPLFREHLLPGVGGWLIAALISLALGLVVFPLSVTAAIVVAAVAMIVSLVVLFQYSPVLEVAGGRFRLGRARIGVEQLGEPTALHGEDWSRAIGQDFEPLAHHCVRGWTRAGIRVEVLDEEDPVTAWVASTRRPDDLVLALRTAQQQDRGD